MTYRDIIFHPAVYVGTVLLGLSGIWLALGAPIGLVTQIAIYTLYGIGVNLLVAYTGLVPFGASVFFGSAGYVAAMLVLNWALRDVFGLALAVVFSAVLALVLGLIILRRKGLYFSLLTLACSQIAYEVAFKWTSMTGGENGLQNVTRTTFEGDETFHYFVVACVIACVWILWRLVHSPLGRALQATRDNEQRAKSLGFNVFGLRLIAFVVMGGIVGFAGGLLTFLLQGVYANNLSWQHAADALLMAVLGGVHHFLGPLWGAITFIVLENRLSEITENWWLIFAPILILFTMLSPEGIQGAVHRLFKNQRWTLTRNTIPVRPAFIPPYASAQNVTDPDKAILKTVKLSKRFGSLVTANEIDFEVKPFSLHSIIGPNGAGKTTLYNMLSGVLPPTGGQIFFEDRDITGLPMHARARLGIGRSFQILSIFPNLSVFENVRIAVQAQHRSIWRFFRDAHCDEEINLRAWSILDAIGLVERAAESSQDLPHGAKRLLEIGITLAINAKLLLLDEPLAGLAEADRVVVTKLIRQLARQHAVLLIEHDIDRVLAISDRISVLHQGRMIADGKPADVARHPDVISAYLGASKQADHVAGPSIERIESLHRPILLNAEKISAGYSGSTVLAGLDLVIHEGEAVALLGRNGVGKTTTLRALTGSLALDGGSIRFDGTDLAKLRPFEINRLGISLVPEGRRLFPNLNVVENLQLAQRDGGMSIDDVFELFPRLRTRKSALAENLSGGERQMVAIGRALMVPSKLVLLDEPFEGLAPSVVHEVMEALVKLRGRVAMIIVEHHAEAVLPIVDRAFVLVNGEIAFSGSAAELERDKELQARLLGVVDTNTQSAA